VILLDFKAIAERALVEKAGAGTVRLTVQRNAIDSEAQPA
jgi:hypothetical protein